MKRIVVAGIAGLLLAVCAATVASAATVTIRVEGGTQTLVPETVVTPSSDVVVDKTAQGGTISDGAKGCGALEIATGGDWGGKAYSFGGPPSQAVEVVKGEAWPFSQTDASYSFLVNNQFASVGLCDYEPQQGDELLLYVGCYLGTSGCFTGEPLDIKAPTKVVLGRPFAVDVTEFTNAVGAPSDAATVSGGAAPATSDAAGKAQVTLTEPGFSTLTVTKGGRVRDSVRVCASNGADGYCDYAIPGPGNTPDPGGPGVIPGPGPGGEQPAGPDTTAPFTRITSVKEGQVFRKRKRAPRTIRATVEEAGGIASVRMALTRKVGKRCTAFSGAKEKFVKTRCGRHPTFSIGDRAAVDFLLPKRVGKGRYVLDVFAIDKAGNRERLARGTSRKVFTVR